MSRSRSRSVTVRNPVASKPPSVAPGLGLLLALSCVGLAACGGDDAPADTSSEVSDTDVVDVDTSPPDTRDTRDTADTQLPDLVEDVAEVEVEDPDVVINPFEVEDDSRRFLPEPEPPPEPVRCAALVNAGAEAGDLLGWQVETGSFLALSGFPPPYDGAFSFRAGTSGRSRLVQEVAATAGQIARLRVMVRSHDGTAESWIGLRALAADGTVLSSRSHGPYIQTDWREADLALALPAGTTRVALYFEGVRSEGTRNEAYFDEAELCFYDREPQPIVADIPGPPYLMNVGADRVTVLLETRRPVPVTIEFGTDPDDLDQVASSSAKTTHVIRITGLEPFTRYWYRVRFADFAMAPYEFLTARAPDDDGRIELIMFADNQDGPAAFRRLARQMEGYDPDFMLHGGDVVQNGTRWDYRETFFAPYFGLGNRAAILMGPGNHETYSSGIFTSAAARALWEEYVDQPNDEHCFGVRWGALFVMVIDTELPHEFGTPQYACIESHLESVESQTATFRVALFHRAPLIEFWDSVAGEPSTVTFFGFEMDAPDVREFLAPLFERHRVQLVFNGHNHLYQFVRQWPRFTAWVTSGGGGGTLESGIPESRVNDWSPFVEEQIFGRYHFLRVIYEKGRLWVRAIGDEDDVMHEFMIEP